MHLDNTKTVNYLACVTGLKLSLALVILAVLTGMTRPDEIGCKLLHLSEKISLAQSAKQQKISIGKLCHGGPFNPVGVDIFATHEKNIGYVFAVVEKLLRETFLPHLFFRKYKSLPPIVGTLSTILVNKFGLDLQKPVTSSDERYQSLQRARTELIRSVTRESDFPTADYL